MGDVDDAGGEVDDYRHSGVDGGGLGAEEKRVDGKVVLDGGERSNGMMGQC